MSMLIFVNFKMNIVMNNNFYLHKKFVNSKIQLSFSLIKKKTKKDQAFLMHCKRKQCGFI